MLNEILRGTLVLVAIAVAVSVAVWLLAVVYYIIIDTVYEIRRRRDR